MTGVTILAEREINVYGFNQVWFWSILGAFLLIGIILGIAVIIREEQETLSEKTSTILIALGLCTLIGLILGGMVAMFIIPVGTETIYDVIIEGNVSFSEFIKHYEIIEQNGLIYTVKEIK